mmetsp:Transcript_16845/g.51798  ORF Transcript_16845/g.51798 Transcript_16845/m.51798 type:complete len:317 (+) Transcript_16845:125-1075(+)
MSSRLSFRFCGTRRGSTGERNPPCSASESGPDTGPVGDGSPLLPSSAAAARAAPAASANCTGALTGALFARAKPMALGLGLPLLAPAALGFGLGSARARRRTPSAPPPGSSDTGLRLAGGASGACCGTSRSPSSPSSGGAESGRTSGLASSSALAAASTTPYFCCCQMRWCTRKAPRARLLPRGMPSSSFPSSSPSSSLTSGSPLSGACCAAPGRRGCGRSASTAISPPPLASPPSSRNARGPSSISRDMSCSCASALLSRSCRRWAFILTVRRRRWHSSSSRTLCGRKRTPKLSASALEWISSTSRPLMCLKASR